MQWDRLSNSLKTIDGWFSPATWVFVSVEESVCQMILLSHTSTYPRNNTNRPSFHLSPSQYRPQTLVLWSKERQTVAKRNDDQSICILNSLVSCSKFFSFPTIQQQSRYSTLSRKASLTTLQNNRSITRHGGHSHHQDAGSVQQIPTNQAQMREYLDKKEKESQMATQISVIGLLSNVFLGNKENYYLLELSISPWLTSFFFPSLNWNRTGETCCWNCKFIIDSWYENLFLSRVITKYSYHNYYYYYYSSMYRGWIE